jgi:hypothetical protein
MLHLNKSRFHSVKHRVEPRFSCSKLPTDSVDKPVSTSSKTLTMRAMYRMYASVQKLAFWRRKV